MLVEVGEWGEGGGTRLLLQVGKLKVLGGLGVGEARLVFALM